MTELRMPQINFVCFSARLTNDAETGETTSGVKWCRVNVAINNGYKKDGQWVDEACFVKVSLWRGVAEFAATLKKGDPVFITGKMKMEKWTDKEGKERMTISVQGDGIQLMAKKEKVESDLLGNNKVDESEPL